MIEIVQTWLEALSDFIWDQFQKDIEWSEAILNHCERIFVTLRDHLK